VDEAAAKLKMEITSKPEALDVIDRQARGREGAAGWGGTL
jgi:ATP-dependent Clp protease ATP-binding subunit ClpA